MSINITSKFNDGPIRLASTTSIEFFVDFGAVPALGFLIKNEGIPLLPYKRAVVIPPKTFPVLTTCPRHIWEVAILDEILSVDVFFWFGQDIPVGIYGITAFRGSALDKRTCTIPLMQIGPNTDKIKFFADLIKCFIPDKDTARMIEYLQREAAVVPSQS